MEVNKGEEIAMQKFGYQEPAKEGRKQAATIRRRGASGERWRRCRNYFPLKFIIAWNTPSLSIKQGGIIWRRNNKISKCEYNGLQNE